MYNAGAAYTAKIYHDAYPTITAANCDQCGRAVFVSGASRGIGRAIAIAFVQAGASAIGIGSRPDRNEVANQIAEEAAKAGHPVPHVLQLRLDISREESVRDASLEILRQFGRLDILVNDARCLEKWQQLADTESKSWWRTWEVNVKGTYLMTRAFLPILLQGGEKTIVNINSVGAHLTRPGASAYQTGKLAMLRLMDFTNAEYSDQGVLAFAVHPGAVYTELIQNLLPSRTHHSWRQIRLSG